MQDLRTLFMAKSRIGSAFCTASDPLPLLYHTMKITEDERFTVFPKFVLFFVRGCGDLEKDSSAFSR